MVVVVNVNVDVVLLVTEVVRVDGVMLSAAGLGDELGRTTEATVVAGVFSPDELGAAIETVRRSVKVDFPIVTVA